jgi:DNA-binding CsgD family transcriptional regulator
MSDSTGRESECEAMNAKDNEGLPVEAIDLSDREKQVAHKVAEGLTNRQIAKNLGISEKTVETHMRNIFRKIRIVSRAQLAAYIVSFG